MNQTLKKTYYNPIHPAGYAGGYVLINALKNKYKTYKIKKWLQKQDTYTLHKPLRKKFPRNKYIVNNIDQLWQADLIDMRGIAKYNQGVNYILTVIDVFSKYAFAEPLKTKTSLTVKNAFHKILTQSKRVPQHVQTDKGKEFVANNIQKYFKKQNIVYSTTSNPDVKAAVVERFNRTLKNRMWRYLTHHNTYSYYKILKKLIYAYNHTKHSSIKMAPADVNESNILRVWYNLYSKSIKIKKPKFKVGDTVRISKEKSKFEKGYENNWSIEVFKIKKLIKRPLPMYKIEDLLGEEIEGAFYEYELQKVIVENNKEYKIDKIIDIKGKGSSTKALVKWKGYPSTFNSWILAKDILKV